MPTAQATLMSTYQCPVCKRKYTSPRPLSRLPWCSGHPDRGKHTPRAMRVVG